MLQTIREFAAEQLERSEHAALRERHARHYAAVAEATHLSADSLGQQRHDLALLDADNFRAALGWASDHGETELGLEIAASLENFWATQDPREGIRWFELLLRSAEDVPAKLRARALRSMGSSTTIFGEYERGRRLYEESLELSRSIGDEAGVAHMLLRLSVEAARGGDSDTAERLASESLARAREVGSTKTEAQALTAIAGSEWRAGNRRRARELGDRARQLSADSGFVWWECIVVSTLAEWALERGDLDEADQLAREALRLAARMNDRLHMVEGLAVLAWAAVRRGDIERAGRLWAALEAEESRGPIRLWGDVRAQYAAEMPSGDEPAFRHGLDAGRLMPLGDAVAFALAGGTN
jgi:non-specific serine/threonine protein kinase